MKPMIIIPPDTMSEADIGELRKNDICVVTAKNPALVKFVDPIPAVSQRSQMETAAVKLSRILISGRWGNYSNFHHIERDQIARMYMDILIEGTPLDSRGTLDERAQAAYESEKIEESRRLARADAKAERDAAKKASAK